MQQHSSLYHRIGRLFALFACLMLMGCPKSSTRDEILTEEETKLRNYIDEHLPTASVYNNCYLYKLTHASDSMLVSTRDYVLVDFVCRYLYEDKVEQASSYDYPDAEFPPNYAGGGPEVWDITQMPFAKLLSEMRETETANLYIPSRYTTIDGVTRQYTVTIVKILGPDLTAYQRELMSKYFKTFYAGEADTVTVTGSRETLLYHIVNEGTGMLLASPFKAATSEIYIIGDPTDRRLCKASTLITWPGENANPEYANVLFNALRGKIKTGGRVVVTMPFAMRYGDNLYLSRTAEGYAQILAPFESVLVYDMTIN